MYIFKNRPLSLVLLAFVSSFLISAFSGRSEKLIFSLLLFALLAVLSLILLILRRCRVCFKRRTLTFSVLFASLAAVIYSFLYFDLFFSFAGKYDAPVTSEIRVISVDFSASYSTVVTAETISVDGSSETHKIIAEFGGAADLEPGDTVKCEAVFLDISESNYSESASYYRSKGYSAFASVSDGYTITGTGSLPLKYRIRAFGKLISGRITSCIPGDAGALLNAVIMGDRDRLPDHIKLCFRRCGISHILALSGFHITVIASLLQFFLARLRVRKKPRFFICSLFVLFYAAMTGFPASVMRAGIMYLIFSATYLLSVQNDAFTSVFIAVSLIFIFVPTSVYDIGLWLSALSTLGIVVYAEYRSRKPAPGIFGKIVTEPLMVSVSAILAILPVLVFAFGAVSVIAPFLSLLFGILFQIYIFMGILVIPFGSISLISYIVELFGNFIINAVGFFSELKYVYLGTVYPEAHVLSIVIFLLLIIFIAGPRRGKIPKRIAVISLCMIFVSSLFIRTFAFTNSSVTYVNNDDNEILLVRDGGKASVFDITGASLSGAYDLSEFFTSENITEIDTYVIFHYHAASAEYLRAVASSVMINTVLMPEPLTEYEKIPCGYAGNYLMDCNVDVSAYSPEIKYDAAPADFTVLYRTPSDENSHSAFAFAFSLNGRIYTYFSEMFTSKYPEITDSAVSYSDCVIFGSHGPSAGSDYTLDLNNSKFTEVIASSPSIKIKNSDIEDLERDISVYLSNIVRLED